MIFIWLCRQLRREGNLLTLVKNWGELRELNREAAVDQEFKEQVEAVTKDVINQIETVYNGKGCVRGFWKGIVIYQV